MPFLVHGTAIALGTSGLLLVGPSGSGKSSLALRLIVLARQHGHFAALLSDDQVFLEAVGGHVIASAPETIRGMIELRGSGIGQLETIGEMRLDFALQPVPLSAENRIPEENQRWRADQTASLPLFFIDRDAADPFSILAALLPGFPVSGNFNFETICPEK